MAHATPADLDAVPSSSYTPGNAALLLERASRDIDRALVCAIYDDDDADVLAVLADATVEQVAYMLECGNTSGIAHGMQPGVASGASAGGVDLSRGTSVGGATAHLPWLGAQAFVVLQQAGLTGQGPIPV